MISMSVARPSRSTPRRTAELVLQQDEWNDFSFRTQYHLYYFGEGFSGFVGNVKILKRGQQGGPEYILPEGPLDPLSEHYCSLGQSLDYYERLANLPAAVRSDILLALRDAIRYPDFSTSFVNEPGWTISVLRDLDLDSYAPLARVLISQDYSALPSRDVKIRFTPRGWKRSLNLHFAGVEGGADSAARRRLETRLPERVAVVTGTNGSGKSTLLARLARVLHASQADRAKDVVRRLGRIRPEGIGFTRVVTVSYSAFDTFHVPGVTRADKRQIMTDLREGTGRYVFCGLRDIAREIEMLLQDEEGRDEDAFEQFDVDLGDFSRDRQHTTFLKSADELAAEFSRMVDRIGATSRNELFYDSLGLLLADASFADSSGTDARTFLTRNPRAMFLKRSTGHKIVLHIIAGLVAYVQRKSIVLIDEPESHLHPPLLAATMHAVRKILAEQDAFCVIATHSPVVAQETLGKHVYIVRRSDDVFRIRQPRIETYGESIGELTEEIFGLSTDATDYHAVLDELVEQGRSLEDIDRLFEKGLSLQSQAYVMSRIVMRDGSDQLLED